MATAIAVVPSAPSESPRRPARLTPDYPRAPALGMGAVVVSVLFWLLGHLLNPRAAAGAATDREIAVLPVSRIDPKALPPPPDAPKTPPPTPRPETPPPPAPSPAPADAASAAAAAAQAAAATPPPPALAQLAATATPPALSAPVPDIAFDLPPVPTVNPAALSIAAPAGLESRTETLATTMAEVSTALPAPEAMGTVRPLVLSFAGGQGGGGGAGAGRGRGQGSGNGSGTGIGTGAGARAGARAGAGAGTGVGSGTGTGRGAGGTGTGAGTSRPVPRAADRAPPRFAIGQGFTGAELVPLSTARPQMPADACRKKIRGVVEVVFYVGPDGHVFDPAVVSATPPGVFEAAALESVTYWIYPRDKYGRYREVQQKIPMLPEDCAYNYGASRAE